MKFRLFLDNRRNKISTSTLKVNQSKNLILNISILVLILINSVLAYSVINSVSARYFNSDDELLIDSTKVKIQAEVLNGCGVTDVAQKITEYLRAHKVDVVNLGNYRSFEIENSIIICRNDKIKYAEKVAAIVGLDHSNIIQQTNPDYLLDVTFILGKDYRNLKPINQR
ncbi:MAG: LytR family transcriptional regulator [Ignavibacteriae bacterium]|nr:MAG: LytR family transcriptional regulator [Chlorobiota bacterium]MBL1123733.1 LytR family transcriptional regulator [Ignavibacteriota bacterium]MCE7855620.1 LytR family transcriptional regulator [Ignavibacteria bacterium CHB3]